MTTRASRKIQQLLSIQTFVSETAVETFDIAVLPRAPRLYVERLDLIFMEPSLDFPGDKLRAIVATDMLWQAIGHHRLPECS